MVAKKTAKTKSSKTANSKEELLTQPAEVRYANELKALENVDGERPEGWRLSPQAVVTYLLGGTAPDGTEISAKYVGRKRLIETAVATLATDRALLLLGVPGTAKSWVSEHFAAAISGDSQRVIQCTAGTDENQIRYGWNYATLLSKGPCDEALVRTPLMRAMQEGTLVRFEELTRMGSDVQDTLITVLSEKILPIPELDKSISAKRGFNIIATANNRDKGVNDLSSALKRRFNVVVLPLPDTLEEEVDIVMTRIGEIGTGLGLPSIEPADKELIRVVEIFRELRNGQTSDGKIKLKTPSGSMSTAEAIAVGIGAWAEAGHFRSGVIDADSLAVNLVGAIVKDPVQDTLVLHEYLETVVRPRKEWRDLYGSIKDVL